MDPVLAARSVGPKRLIDVVLPFLLIGLLIFAPPARAQHSRPDLLRMMRSGDPHDRALARQLLPRWGVERLEDILPALADPNEAVWRTAANILRDVANEVSAPGRDAERERFAGELLTRLDAKPGPDEAARLLNVIHLALPEGMDVHAIAAYLKDPALRMNARDALQLAGTTEACKALISALSDSEGVFAFALIDALGMLRNPDSREALAARLRDEDPALRAAAARSLAWTGDAGLVPEYRDLVRKADKDTRDEAGNALLLLVDEIANRGGQFDYAVELYSWCARNLPSVELRGAAVASLGRRGDERALPLILAAARREKKGALDHAALEALAALPGNSASAAIFDSRRELLKQFGPALYSVYGRRRDPRFIPLLIDAADSGDAFAQHAALLALLDSDQAEGIRAAAARALSLADEPRAALSGALALKAAEFTRRNAAEAAAAAYAGLYRLTADEHDRKFALAGMMRYPSEDAFALVKDLVGQDELAGFSVTFLAGIARALYDAKRPEDAQRVLDSLLPRLSTPEDMQAFLGSIREAGPDLARSLGFITKWHVIGPFPWTAAEAFSENHIGAPAVDLSVRIASKAGDSHAWTPHEAGGPSAIVDLTGILGMQTSAAAYAYAEIDLAEATSGTLHAGSDDGIKIWVNGEVAHEHNVDRGLAVDQDQAAVQLKAGGNKILVEITQGAGGWNFCLRLTSTDGRPLKFTQ